MSDPTPRASSTTSKTFKPRAGIVRKSKAEREAHARQEAEKAAVRAAAAVQATGKATQATKSSTTRKRDAPRDTRDTTRNVVGGVFGAASGTRSGWKKPVQDAGRSEMLEGQDGVKPSEGPSLQGDLTETKGVGTKGAGGGSGGPARASKADKIGSALESDDEPDEPRRDIERICISSDEEENNDEVEENDTVKGKARALSEGRRKLKQGLGLRPVRAPRSQAEDSNLETERKSERKIVKSTRTVVDDADALEEGDEGGEMEIDDRAPTEQPAVKQDIPSSPEFARRGKPGRKSSARSKESKVVTEMVEERAERLRLRDDIEKLREEFVLSPKVKRDVDMEPEMEGLKPGGKLLLFQFPPLVPFLLNQSVISSMATDGKQPAVEPVPTIKSDPDGPGSTVPINVDALNPQPNIPQTQLEGMFTANEPHRLPPGRVGKLMVHKSGKVSLDWGGTDMEIRYGTEVDFLQDAVLVETPNQSEESGEQDSASQGGTAYALGQVQKKMIVIPDWQKLYD